MFMLDTAGLRERQRRWLIVLAWSAALCLAFAVDGPVARAVHPWREAVKRSVFAEEIKEGGHVGITLVAALLLLAIHPRRWWAVSLLISTAVTVGIMRAGIALLAGRLRPIVEIDPFAFFTYQGGIQGILHARNLSFPSGHASLAFASAAALSYAVGRGNWLFYAGATLVGIERIAESAHYVSDVVAAALLGGLAFRLALHIHTRMVATLPLLDEPLLT